jgi:hypothetical protein
LKDCKPPYREKANRWLISVGCQVMSYLRRQRRFGSRTAAALVVALTIVTAANAVQWPDGWWTSIWGRAGLVALTVVSGAATFLVVVGYQSLLGRSKRREIVAQAAEDLVRLIETSTEMDRSQFGVNVWVIKGMKGFRRLVRGPSISDKHSDTPIVWTKGKGIIGQSWKRSKIRYADLDQERADYPAQADWCKRSREDRYRLSWDEFGETDRYRAVVAVPLRTGGAVAKYRVRGVLAMDALIPGKAADLEALTKTPAFRAIRRACETAFISEVDDPGWPL